MTRAENRSEGERAAAGWRETDSGSPGREGEREGGTCFEEME